MLRSFYKYAALGLAAVGATSAFMAPVSAKPSVIADNRAYVTVIATMHTQPQYYDMVGKELKNLAMQVRAERGNVVFMPYSNPDESNSYVVYEVYRNEAAFQTHINSNHTRAFNKLLETQALGGKSDVAKVKTIF
ncbi:MAG: putative quinol monooxygenase [Zymomonas mobilis subsp. pomaceae]|uniref:putative quinol monooxygenase n=1 Tax=Zymomonas mobilis TaxID=542 RepID=UPI0039EC06E3